MAVVYGDGRGVSSAFLQLSWFFMNIWRYPVNTRSRLSRFCVLVLGGYVLAGCAQMANTPQNPQPAANTMATTSAQENTAFSQISDLPIPPGSTMNIERTFIVGSAGSWYGQTMIDAPGGGNMAFDFFKKELTGYGWQELSSVRARTSVLTYTREMRVLAIQLTEVLPGHTEVMITVSPRGGDGSNNSDLLQPVQ